MSGQFVAPPSASVSLWFFFLYIYFLFIWTQTERRKDLHLPHFLNLFLPSATPPAVCPFSSSCNSSSSSSSSSCFCSALQSQFTHVGHSGHFRAAGKLNLFSFIRFLFLSLFWGRLLRPAFRFNGVSEEHVAQSDWRRRRRCSCGQVFLLRGTGEDLFQECGGGSAAQTSVCAPLVWWVAVRWSLKISDFFPDAAF